MLLNIYRHDALSASSQCAQRNQPLQWVLYAMDKVCRPTIFHSSKETTFFLLWALDGKKKNNEEALESPAHPEAKSYREVLSGYNLEITTSYKF